jgi:XTP/dITP diphosphohydrolase
MELVFASSNKNKIAEVRSLLPASVNLKGLSEIGITGDIPETGITIRENSFLKASSVADHLKRSHIKASVFADDSGLEVETLSGAPGVFSARYAGEPKNDNANNMKLLLELKNVTKRQARFVTVITLIDDKGSINYFEGEITGTIAYEPRGTNGFGYDPLFIPRGYRSTFAELSAEEKNKISHRAVAVKKLVGFLSALKA